MYLSLIPAILNTVAASVSDFYAQLILAGFYMTVYESSSNSNYLRNLSNRPSPPKDSMKCLYINYFTAFTQ